MLLLTLSCRQGTVKEQIEKQIPNYSVLEKVRGSFIGSNKEEYLVFLGNTEDIKRYFEDNGGNYSRINRMNVITFDDAGKLEKSYAIKDSSWMKSDGSFWSYNIKEVFPTVMEDSKVNFGKWNISSLIGDFNQNGFDEILFFEGTEEGIEARIYEYSVLNNLFRKIGDIGYCDQISIEKEKDKIYISVFEYRHLEGSVDGKGNPYGPNNPMPANPVRYDLMDYTKYTWDEKKQFYVKVASGEKVVKGE